MQTFVANLTSTAMGRALIFGVIAALLTSGGITIATTVTSGDLGTSSVKLTGQTFSDDADVTVTAVGVIVNGSTGSAAGDSAPGVEVTSSLPAVNNALTKGNYAYKVQVKEASATSFQLGENLKIEVYGDDGSTTSLLATHYTQQSTVDDANVEGVTVTTDLGSSSTIHSSFDVIVSRQ